MHGLSCNPWPFLLAQYIGNACAVFHPAALEVVLLFIGNKWTHINSRPTLHQARCEHGFVKLTHARVAFSPVVLSASPRSLVLATPCTLFLQGVNRAIMTISEDTVVS